MTAHGFKGISKRKLKSGTKYRFQVSYRGEKYSSPSVYDTPVQAELAKREKLIEMELMHSKAESQPLSLSELVQRRTQNLELKRSPKYAYCSERFLQQMVDGLGANKSVLSITKPQIIKFLDNEANRLLSRGKGLQTANQLMATMKAFFNWCIDEIGINIVNPCVRIKPYSVTHRQKYIPPYEHIMIVREHLNHSQRQLIDFLLQTGSRISSALWLTVESIKWKDKRLALFTSKSRHGDHSYYIIPIPQVIYDMKQEGNLPANGRVFYRWKEATNPHFLFRTIKKINENPVDSEYARVYEVEHIPVFSYHSFRHRAATQWVNKGMRMREVQLRLGHSNITMTERYIAKLLGFKFSKFTDDIFEEW